MEEQVLKDFIATAQANNYNYDVVMPKFPELSGYDLQVLKDYIATAEASNYDYNTVNAKFPELFSTVKKKVTASVSEPGSLVSPEPEVPVAEPVVEEEVQDLTVAEPDFFEERMAMVSPQLIDRGDEDEVAKELTDVFKPYGFEVEPTSIGDALKVTAANGETIEVDLDPMELPSFLSVGRFGFTGDMDTETEKSEAKKLQDFLRENRQEGLDAPRKFVTQEQIDTNVKKINESEEGINKQFLSYVERKSIFDAEFAEAFPVNDVQAVAADPEGYNDFVQRGRDLDIEAQGLRQNDELLKEQGRELDKAAGEYTSMLANRGDWGGGLWNKMLTGIGRISEEAYNVAMDKVTGAIPLMTTDPAYYQSRFTEEAERRGITPPYGTDGTKATRAAFLSFMTSIDSDIRNEIGDKVVDDYKKERKFGEPIDVEKAVNRYSQYAASENMKLKGGELEAVRNGLLNVLGDSETTPEWTQLKEQGFWGGAFLGLAESIPAMVVPGGWAARTAAMYGQVASHLGQEMASIPEFQDVSEKEKAMFKLPLGIVVGALESIGFRNVVNQKGLLNSLLMQALKKSPKNVTGKAFNDIVDREVNSMISRGLLKVGAGGLAEFETGLAQEIADITGKEIYNALKEKEMFDTPESFGEGLEQVVIGGLQEAVGGLVLGVPNAVATSSSKKDFTDMDDATFELFQNVSKQTDSGQLSYRHMFYTNLKSKINQGKISKKEAQQQMDNLDEVIAVNRDIPSDLTLEQQKRSLGILLRKKDLQEQIEGKDPILVKRQQEELNSLNRELDQILYGTPQEDAIQEPSPETVDAPEPTRGSEAVGEGVPDIGEPTAEVEAEDQVAEAAPTAEVAVEEGAEVELEVTTTDKKGRTLKFFKTTTEKDGVKTTRFTFNRSDKSPEQRNTSKATPVEEALGGLYEFEVPESLQENGAVPVAVTEVRESESGASATVVFEQDGQRFEDEVLLTPKTQEVAVEETVSEPTQEVTEEEQVDIDDFFSDKEIEGVDKVADNLVVNRKQLSEDKVETAQDERKISRIKQIAKKAAVSLKKEFPDVRIVLHETEGQYKRFAGKRARGAYVKDDKSKTIHINLSIADLSTVPHEVFHSLILEAAATDPQALVIARNMLESVRKVVDPNSEMSKVIEKFVAKYEDVPVIQDEEYLAELMGILSSQYRTLDKPSKNTVKEFLRKLAKLVGIDTKFGLDEFFGPEFLERDEQVIDLLNTISGKVSKGQFIEAADVQVMGDIMSEATPTEQAQAQREVRDFKRKERERKAVDEAVTPRQQVSITDTDSTNPSFEKGSMKDFSVEGGILEIGKVKGAKQSSVLRLSVDEDNRRQGKATELLKSALNYTNGMLSAMASKDAAVGLNYKLGMRAFSPDGNELSLEETKNQRAENAGESIRMELPDSKKGNNYKAFDEAVTPRMQVADIPQSAKNVLYGDSDVLPKPSKKKSNSQVAQDLAEVAAEYYGGEIITSKTITPEQEETITEVGTEEAIAAFEDSGKSAADWYSTAIEKAMAVAAVIHPSLISKEEASKYEAFAKEKDPVAAANFAMRVALAITSQNLNVEANAKYANEQFDIFKKTGRFDASREYGTKAKSISSNLRLANVLVEKIGLNATDDFVLQEFNVSELEVAASKALGKNVKVSGLRNDKVNGAALFGPKIGQGFLQNLMGKFDPVTIDLWLRRTWGRWTGDVVGVGVKEERMARLLNGLKEAKKDTGVEVPDVMKKYRVVRKVRPSTGASYDTMSDQFISELEEDAEFRDKIAAFAKTLSTKGDLMYKLIKNEPMSDGLYKSFMSGEKTYGQTANQLQRIKDKLSAKYKDYVSKEKDKGRTPLKKSEWVKGQNQKDGRVNSPNNEAISARKPEWVKAATSITNDLKPIDIPTNQDRKVITRIVNDIKKRMTEQGYPVTNADVQALLWYPEKDIWAKLRGEEESNLKQSYDDQFIKIAEQKGLGKEAKSAAENVERERAAQPSGVDERKTDVGVSRPTEREGVAPRQQLAPNGRPSNLNEEQYKIVRTPAFKKWFGDWENDPENSSKVVDENKEPMVMYHGTSLSAKADIAINGFDSSKGRNGLSGFSFMSEKGLTKAYDKGAVLDVFLNLKNPMDFEKNFEIRGEIIKKVSGKDIKEMTTPDWLEYTGEISRLFEKEAIRLGYDGVFDVQQPESKVFKNTNIKTADGSNTTFDTTSPSIRQQLEDIATPLPRQQKSVREVVQQARDNNFKDAATKDFLKRKGVPTADIDKAIKTLDDVYARVMKEIDGVITKSQKRGVDFDTQLKNALAYLQGTKLYEDTTDIHREKLMREVRAKFDKKEKRAPSAKRILGNIKDVKKVTLSEKEALKMQLRLVAKTAKTTARALVVAGNELTKSLKEMVKGGVITANQMSSVLRRFSRVDLFNPASIDSFLDYMAKIFADAEYGAKIARIKKLLPRAKKNIKSKIGVADVLGDTLTKLFNVNPTLIPMEMLEDYQNLLEMMGAAKKVLSLADINDVTEVANKLLNAVYEEVSMAEDLAEVFANYENKVIKDGKVDYAATIEAMIADQTISLEEAAVMRKYKSRIVEPTKKEPKTEEELAEERAELMSAVEAAKVNVSRLVMDEERTLARQLAKLIRTEAIERLSNQQLETLLAVIDNINNGFVTHAAQRLAEAMNASNRAGSFFESLVKAVPLPVSTFVGKIKSGITKNNKFFESVKRNPLAYIDQVFGDFQTTRIYDAIFKPLAQAYDTFSLEMKRVDQRLTDAQEAVMKSFKNDPNKARMSSYKMMAYMLQREFEANPDNKQVNPAADFIRATIDHINKGQSFFKGKDAEMLQQILDDFGGEQIDSQKLYDSFNKAERNALAVMEDINKSMGSKAVFTGAVIRGRRVDALNQYAHHNVLSTSGQMDRSADVSIIEAYNQSMRASTKAKNLIERTGAATPLNFDVFSSVSRGSRFTLTDFYLTEPIRTSRKTISDTRKLLEERGDVTKQENEIINAVENALELTLDDLLTRTFSQSTMLENVVQYVKKTGYRLVLASGTRAMAEGASNLAFAAIYAPKDFAVGRANKTVLGAVGIDVMGNLKSTQLSRMYPNEILSGRMIDTSVLGEKAGDKGGRAYSDVLNKATQIYNGLLLPAKKSVEKIADGLISYPDKAVIRPLWFGSFENAFVEITGKKPDFEKIAANDEAYMAANQEALNKATDTADQLTTLAGAADNPFKSMLRGKYPSKAKQTALLQFFNNFNSFMTRFLIYEYISARTAVNAMLGNGMISKRQGAALLGAVTTRMVVYTLAGTILNQIMKQAFGLDEEEDEKDIMKQFGQSLASTATSLIVGRDFGNVVKGLLNYGVENINEEFLDELREGDYDPYRDAIAYTFVPPDKEYKSNTLSDYIRNLMGPFGPFYKMAEFGVKTLSADEKKDPAARIRQQRELNERLPLEVLGNIGLIPLYRDIRALLLADIYKGMGKDKKGSSTGMTKAEKAQMKEYFPEMYEMQMQMEEEMKNPELERMMKEQEKAIEEMMKGLK